MWEVDGSQGRTLDKPFSTPQPRTFFTVGPPRALQAVQRHPGAYPTKRQCHPLAGTTKKSPDAARCPLEGRVSRS